MSERSDESAEDVVVATIGPSKLDQPIVQAITEDLLRLQGGRAGCKLMLDFQNVQYLNSHALATLITLHKKVTGAKGKLILCNLDAKIRENFHLTRLEKLFTIERQPLSPDEKGLIVPLGDTLANQS